MNKTDLLNMCNELISSMDIIDIDIKFHNNNEFLYNSQDNSITVPLNLKLRQPEIHHICWIKSKYNLDLKNINESTSSLLEKYYIFCILHEIGHSRYNNIDNNTEYINYINIICNIREDYDMYRSITSESFADKYACELWLTNYNVILNILNKYSKFFN